MNTTLEDDSRQFIISHAVADIKYNIRGTPLFEDYTQNINNQDFTLQFKHQLNVHPNYTRVTLLLSKDYPYFSYKHKTKSRTLIRFNLNSSNNAHLPYKTTIFFILQLHERIIFPTFAQTYFSTQFRKTFTFIEVFTQDKPDTCATIKHNSTNRLATLPTGQFGYIEILFTNEKPKDHQVNDIYSLVPNVALTNQLDITELTLQTNYAAQYTEETPFG